jgi:hypothetical protein
MKRAVLEVMVIPGLILGLNLPGLAQQTDFGKAEYQASCAACHGVDGKGTGPLGEELKTKPADLTMLAKQNNGVFPIERVYETIDGRKTIKPHGTRDMPIWGYRYTPTPVPGYSPSAPYFIDPLYDRESVVRGRILAVIDYLYRLQAK